MTIEQRIKIIKQKMDKQAGFNKFFMVTQTEPNSKKYEVEERYKSKIKKYIIDDIEKFYKENNSKDNHILRVDIVDNSHLESVLYEVDEEG